MRSEVQDTNPQPISPNHLDQAPGHRSPAQPAVINSGALLPGDKSAQSETDIWDIRDKRRKALMTGNSVALASLATPRRRTGLSAWDY